MQQYSSIDKDNGSPPSQNASLDLNKLIIFERKWENDINIKGCCGLDDMRHSKKTQIREKLSGTQ